MTDKIEGVQKVTQSMGNQPTQGVPEVENTQPNPEQFQQLLDTKQNTQLSFERVDGRSLNVDETEKLEKNPIFAQDANSTQKGGSSTDQEGKRGQQQSNEVEGVSGVKNNKKVLTPAASMNGDVQRLGTKVENAAALSPGELKKQAKDVINQIEQVKTQLAKTKEIKPAYQTLLKNQLSHIDDNLKIAMSKAGVEYQPKVEAKENSNPVLRFIDSLTGSQDQLDGIYSSLDAMDKTGQKTLSPAAMMAMQIKVGNIQQQIELFTNLLNKALESTKTVMNVQV